GVQFRTGRFMETEKVVLEATLCRYQETHQLDDEQMEDLIFGTTKQDGFWSDIARALPGRRLRSVYDYVQRTKHPLHKKRPWTDQDDVQLKIHIENNDKDKHDWTEIGDRMSRPAAECRDRYHKRIVHHELTLCAGRWSLDEEARLVQIMQDLGTDGKTNDTLQHFCQWKEVARRMDKTRSAKQCRDKWIDTLRHKVENGGKAHNWTPQDSFILVHKVASLEVNSKDAIDWKSLPDKDWHHWSAHRLQQKWGILEGAVNTPEATHCGESDLQPAI
ncbi:hypothetical protein V8E53_015870, partial [Lactarius tabidus]